MNVGTPAIAARCPGPESLPMNTAARSTVATSSLTVRGTATAASVWNACVIGAAVAMNHYGIAVVLTLLNLFTLRALLPLKLRLDARKTQGVGGM